MVKVERKVVHVTDGVKVKQFNIVQILPVQTGNPTVDEDLEFMAEHSNMNDPTEAELQHHDVCLNEVLQPGDPRTRNTKAKAAVKLELEGLYAQGVFAVVRNEDIPKGAVIIPSRMVYEMKNIGTKEEKYKARLATGGHRDRMKKLYIHNSVNFRHVSVRTMASTAAIMGWLLWLKDAFKAFLQSVKMTQYVALLPAS